jgi:glucosamine--fructose-6-phosphate aminotransferase (isomerizing)
MAMIMPAHSNTMMFTEASEAPEVVQKQLDRNAATVRRIGQKLKSLKPGFVITVARGSSDHAACFAKYLLETRCGLFTASTGPSIFSIYKKQMNFSGCFCLLISQSGASPDLLAAASAARKAGAYVVALVNVADSPLAGLADEVLELHAGPETSVAATKSFIASLTALIHLVSAWNEDPALDRSLHELPGSLQEAWKQNWDAALDPIAGTNGLYVLGRGLGLGIASEAALKFKEVCGLHAEAFSSAEVLHGPVTIARANFPVLVMAQNDETLEGIRGLLDKLADRDVKLITAGIKHNAAINLPVPGGHPVIDPVLRIQSFYRMANALSLQLGLNPDCPPFLQKVTATV